MTDMAEKVSKNLYANFSFGPYVSFSIPFASKYRCYV